MVASQSRGTPILGALSLGNTLIYIDIYISIYIGFVNVFFLGRACPRKWLTSQLSSFKGSRI